MAESVRLLLRVFLPFVVPAPRRNRVRVTLTGLAFTTTVRVVDRVHDHAADGRADALPALGAGLAELAEVVLAVADFTDGGAAVDVHAADSPDFKRSRAVPPSRAASWAEVPADAAIWPPLPGLSSMLCTVLPTGIWRSDIGVTGLDGGFRTRGQLVAGLDARGAKDVTALAVTVR
jgi:hypothetical protein